MVTITVYTNFPSDASGIATSGNTYDSYLYIKDQTTGSVFMTNTGTGYPNSTVNPNGYSYIPDMRTAEWIVEDPTATVYGNQYTLPDTSSPIIFSSFSSKIGTLVTPPERSYVSDTQIVNSYDQSMSVSALSSYNPASLPDTQFQVTVTTTVPVSTSSSGGSGSSGGSTLPIGIFKLPTFGGGKTISPPASFGPMIPASAYPVYAYSYDITLYYAYQSSIIYVIY